VTTLLVVASGLAIPEAAAQQTRGQPQAEPPVTELPPILVTAPAPLPETLPRSSVPGALDILTPDDIRQGRPRVLPDALGSRPGFTLQNEQGTPYQPDLTLRGFVASPVTGLPQGVSVFLDGVRLNEPTAEEVNFDLIPLDDAALIQVIRGPSTLFGRNTLGGAVNILTRRGEERLDLVPELSGGSFGLQKYTLRVGGELKPFDYYLGVRYSEETGWRVDSDARIGGVFGKLGLRIADLDATLSYQYGNNKLKEPGSLPTSQASRDPTANFTAGDFFAPVLNMAILNARYALTERVTLEGNAFVRALHVDQFNVNLAGPNTRLLNETLSTGGRLQASDKTRILGQDNTLIVGAEYTRSDVTSRTFEDDSSGPVLDANLADTQHAVGAYAQDTLTILKGFAGAGSSLVLTLAGRWDYLRHEIEDRLGGPSGGTFTFSRFNPSTGVNLNLSDRLGVYASYGEGFRAPAFLELTCAGPGAVCPGLQAGVAQDPVLKPVVARTYEVGAYTRPLAWLDLDASLYRTDVSDDIFSVSPTGSVGVFFQNVGATRREGAEFAVKARWAKDLEAYFNYEFTRATFQESVQLATPLPPGTERVAAGSSFAMVPHHRVNLGCSWHPWPWATISLGATYVSPQVLRGDEANTQRPLPAYWVVNAGASGRWRGLEAFVSIHNLLDNRYDTFGTFAPDARQVGTPIVRFVTPAPPINVIGGVRYAF